MSDIKFITAAKQVTVKPGTFAFGEYVKFGTITNTVGGKVEHGVIVKSGFARVSSITEYHHSLVSFYKTRFYYGPDKGSVVLYHAGIDYMCSADFGQGAVSLSPAENFDRLMRSILSIGFIKATCPTEYKKRKEIKSLRLTFLPMFLPKSLIHRACEWLENEL